MGVDGPNQPEFVRIHPKLPAEFQASFQRGAGVFVLQHPLFLGRRSRDIADIPAFEVCEFVIRRQQRVGLLVALDLRHLVQRLPAGPLLRIGPIHRLSGARLVGKHQAVAQIPVVRDCENRATRRVFIGGHVFPQVLRVSAVEKRERQGPAGLLGAVSKKDDAM